MKKLILLIIFLHDSIIVTKERVETDSTVIYLDADEMLSIVTTTGPM